MLWVLCAAGCSGKKLTSVCKDPDTGPFQFSVRVVYGPDQSLAGCESFSDCQDRGLDCVSGDIIFFCDSGGQFDSALKATAETLCTTNYRAECRVCDLIRLDEVGGCPLDPSCQTSQPLACCENKKPVCCGGNPGDPGPPFLKDASGSPMVRLTSSPVTVTVDDETATTDAEGAGVGYELSNCSGGACDITFTFVYGAPADFVIAGRHFTGSIIESGHPFTGRIDVESGLFAVPAGAMGIYSYFIVDGQEASIYVTNPLQIVGYASTSADAFLLVGTAAGMSNGESISIDLRLEGSYVDKGPPDPLVAPLVVAECTSPGGALVNLDGSSSSDPDGDALRYFWYEGGQRIATGPAAQVQFALGSHIVEFVALDDVARRSAATQVLVQDTTPPSIDVASDPSCLWPPDRKMVCLTIGDEISAVATDACDSSPVSASIVSVTSSDSTLTDDDIEFDANKVCLRAERSGNNARTYVVTLQSVDTVGNTGTSELYLEVPQDNRNGCRRGQRLSGDVHARGRR